MFSCLWLVLLVFWMLIAWVFCCLGSWFGVFGWFGISCCGFRFVLFDAVGDVVGWICLVLSSFVCDCLLILLCGFDLVWFVSWVAFMVYLFCCCSFLIVLVVAVLSY